MRRPAQVMPFRGVTDLTRSEAPATVTARSVGEQSKPRERLASSERVAGESVRVHRLHSPRRACMGRGMVSSRTDRAKCRNGNRVSIFPAVMIRGFH